MSTYVSLDNFHKDSSNKYGLAYWCKPCAIKNSRANHKRRMQTDPSYKDSKRDTYFKFKYGVSLEERTSLLLAQENKCAICRIPLETSGGHTHTDHCHKTGKIRGILCTNCNRGIGHFKESPDILQAAIQYLLAHTENGNQKEGTGLCLSALS